jgi:hypothetical protein
VENGLKSSGAIDEMDDKLNLCAGQDFLLTNLHSIATGSISPKETLLHIQF